MKNVFKVAGVAAALAVVGTSVYMMNNKQALFEKTGGKSAPGGQKGRKIPPAH